jgi:hypothetical protein
MTAQQSVGDLLRAKLPSRDTLVYELLALDSGKLSEVLTLVECLLSEKRKDEARQEALGWLGRYSGVFLHRDTEDERDAAEAVQRATRLLSAPPESLESESIASAKEISEGARLILQRIVDSWGLPRLSRPGYQALCERIRSIIERPAGDASLTQ